MKCIYREITRILVDSCDENRATIAIKDIIKHKHNLKINVMTSIWMLCEHGKCGLPNEMQWILKM